MFESSTKTYGAGRRRLAAGIDSHELSWSDGIDYRCLSTCLKTLQFREDSHSSKPLVFGLDEHDMRKLAKAPSNGVISERGVSVECAGCV